MTDKQIIARLKTDLDFERTKRKSLQVDLKVKEQEIKNICKAFDIEYAIDEETGNLIGRCNKLYKKEQECEKIKNWVKGMMFYTDCSNWFERFTTAFEDWKNDLISQLDQLKAENEELKKDNSILKDILSYPKYTNENAYNELLRLSKAELIKNLIESHQHGESTTQVVYRCICEKNEKYKQTLTEIKEIAKYDVYTTRTDLCLKLNWIKKKISECEVNNNDI